MNTKLVAAFTVLAAVPAFLSRYLRVPVHLAFSYDEEVGCLGVRPMLAELAKRAHKPALCLIGEPTELKPVLGHKGKLAMRCQVSSRYSSLSPARAAMTSSHRVPTFSA